MSSLADEIKLRRAAKSEPKQGCYTVKAGIPCVRIKDREGKKWILPWTHHVFSSQEVVDQLLLTFASHEVVITGYNLEALEEDIAYHRVEKLRQVPSSYAPVPGPESIVTKIEVRPRDENRKADEAPAEPSEGSPATQA